MLASMLPYLDTHHTASDDSSQETELEKPTSPLSPVIHSDLEVSSPVRVLTPPPSLLSFPRVSPAVPWLAKLYQMESPADQEWQDHGFVFVTTCFSESLGEFSLLLLDEITSQLKFEIPFSSLSCEKDMDKILTWTDSAHIFSRPLLLNVALSFESEKGCNDIYETVRQAQWHSCSYSNQGERRGEDEEEDLRPDVVLRTSSPDDYHITRSNLESFLNEFRQSGPIFKVNFLKCLLNDKSPHNFESILNLFDEIENNGGTLEEFKNIYELVKNIALLDDFELFEKMLEENFFYRVAGCLESDPSLNFRATHREFLQKSHFVEVIPIQSEETRSKIQKRFRLGFFRDVLLGRVLDDACFKRLGNMDNKLIGDIVYALFLEDQFLVQLFARLQASDRGANVVAFFHEFVMSLQKLHPSQQTEVYTKMFSLGLFPAILRILQDPLATSSEKLKMENVLVYAFKQYADIQPEQIHSQTRLTCRVEEANFLGILVQLLLHDPDSGVQAMACNLLENLLDPETHCPSNLDLEDIGAPILPTVAVVGPEMDALEYINRFYHEYFERLFLDGFYENEDCERAHLIAQLLHFCIQTHGPILRELWESHQHQFSLILHALLLKRDKFLVLDGIRLVRLLLSSKDEFYIHFVVEYGFLGRIVELLENTLHCENLIFSACVDVIEYLKANVNNFAVFQAVVGAVKSDRVKNMGVLLAWEHDLKSKTMSPNAVVWADVFDDGGPIAGSHAAVVDGSIEEEDDDMFSLHFVERKKPRLSE